MPRVLAQPNRPGLSVQLYGGYAGLTITGAVGSNYVVRYVTELSPTNKWQTLTNLTLPSSPYLVLDASSPATGQRFYQVGTSASTNQPGPPPGLALIPAGSFTMGDSFHEGSTNELPVHTVSVSALYMDTNLVSYTLWQQVYQWAATNGYGLYDMAGNVMEWCWDFYGGYSSGAQTDPRGPVSGMSRVFRGGSWNLTTFDCRSAFRYLSAPYVGNNFIGFRAVLPAG